MVSLTDFRVNKQKAFFVLEGRNYRLEGQKREPLLERRWPNDGKRSIRMKLSWGRRWLNDRKRSVWMIGQRLMLDLSQVGEVTFTKKTMDECHQKERRSRHQESFTIPEDNKRILSMSIFMIHTLYRWTRAFLGHVRREVVKAVLEWFQSTANSVLDCF